MWLFYREKPILWIDGGIHAREWISPAAVLYVMEQLLVNGRSYNHILDNYNVYILPSVNPDG